MVGGSQLLQKLLGFLIIAVMTPAYKLFEVSRPGATVELSVADPAPFTV